ncbi:pseudouridine synthase [Ottowia sp.]|uniref:pseudouridine synthase n=1 Tax=Ottowia sp. TaxID=1898956 RepID=UPI003A8719DC
MLPILYQDADLIAVHKPAGLLVHRTGLDAGETRFVLQLLRDQIGQPVWPVHRLDKGTSGVLLLALNAATASALGQMFQVDAAVTKNYLAVVRGWPADVGVIDHPLKRMNDDKRSSIRAVQIQPARTCWRTLARYTLPLPYGGFAQTRCALIELQPDTGRRHQLRRHCKHMAHPIIGDATHGKGPLNRALTSHLATQLTTHLAAQNHSVQRLWLKRRDIFGGF